jgi:hypothetical protein
VGRMTVRNTSSMGQMKVYRYCIAAASASKLEQLTMSNAPSCNMFVTFAKHERKTHERRYLLSDLTGRKE